MLAARITDLHVCPAFGGPIVLGMFTVLTCGLPQARVTDACACAAAPDPIIRGSMTVLVGGLPAARLRQYDDDRGDHRPRRADRPDRRVKMEATCKLLQPPRKCNRRPPNFRR